MAGDERRAEVEAATDALLEDSGLRRYGAHRATVERRVRIAFEAVDRLRDARGDDEGVAIAYALRLLEDAPRECVDDCEGMTERTCAACWANQLRQVLSAARSPQDEDHEAARGAVGCSCPLTSTVTFLHEPGCPMGIDSKGFQAAVAVVQPRCDPVFADEAGHFTRQVLTAYLSRVSPSRDGTVAVEDKLRRIADLGRNLAEEAWKPEGTVLVGAQICQLASDVLAEFARSATGEQTGHDG